MLCRLVLIWILFWISNKSFSFKCSVWAELHQISRELRIIWSCWVWQRTTIMTSVKYRSWPTGGFVLIWQTLLLLKVINIREKPFSFAHLRQQICSHFKLCSCVYRLCAGSLLNSISHNTHTNARLKANKNALNWYIYLNFETRACCFLILHAHLSLLQLRSGVGTPF